MAVPCDDVPSLLSSMARGDASAREALFPLLYGELHRLACRYMRSERPDHTLQPTALIHEAWLRLVPVGDNHNVHYENAGHFMATAAVVMRRVLVNHARARNAIKRGGSANVCSLDTIAADFENRSIDLLALDEALSRLQSVDETQHRIVELRFFAGMTFAQCAEVLELSERTVFYEWAHARAWLRCQLEGEP